MLEQIAVSASVGLNVVSVDCGAKGELLMVLSDERFVYLSGDTVEQFTPFERFAFSEDVLRRVFGDAQVRAWQEMDQHSARNSVLRELPGQLEQARKLMESLEASTPVQLEELTLEDSGRFVVVYQWTDGKRIPVTIGALVGAVGAQVVVCVMDELKTFDWTCCSFLPRRK